MRTLLLILWPLDHKFWWFCLLYLLSSVNFGCRPFQLRLSSLQGLSARRLCWLATPLVWISQDWFSSLREQQHSKSFHYSHQWGLELLQNWYTWEIAAFLLAMGQPYQASQLVASSDLVEIDSISCSVVKLKDLARPLKPTLCNRSQIFDVFDLRSTYWYHNSFHWLPLILWTFGIGCNILSHSHWSSTTFANFMKNQCFYCRIGRHLGVNLTA